MNLFWSTRALTQSKEDHLTEFFAAALTLNEHVRNAYAELVFGRYAQENGWRNPVIEKVETQVLYDGTNCQLLSRHAANAGRWAHCHM